MFLMKYNMLIKILLILLFKQGLNIEKSILLEFSS